MAEQLPDFTGKHILITAGPTREAIDPVRYISNHSSGKMGYAIAESFLKAGAEVVLISGPVALSLNHSALHIVDIESAAQMFQACSLYFEWADIAVFAAAVADYRPETTAELKIKKAGDNLNIRLVRNIDIAGEFGQLKKPAQLSIGFALETDHELENARQKLTGKNFDLIILNSTNDTGATFGHDTNKIRIIGRGNMDQTLPLKLKSELAVDILEAISNLP